MVSSNPVNPDNVAPPRGRPFAKGNPGRKRGSRNRTTVLADALSDSDKDKLLRKALDLALGGDVAMLKVFIERLYPRERRVKFDVPPMKYADDVVPVSAKILEAVGHGEMSLDDGAALETLVNSLAKNIERADVTKRLDLLEGEVFRKNGG